MRSRTRTSSSSPGSSPTAPPRSTTIGRPPTCSTRRSPRACSSCTTSSTSTASSPIPGNDTMDNQFLAGQVAMITRGHWIVQNVQARPSSTRTSPSRRPRSTTTRSSASARYAYRQGHQERRRSPRPLVAELTGPEAETEEGQVRRLRARRRKPRLNCPTSWPSRRARRSIYQTLPHTKAVPSPANFQEVEKIFIRYYTAMMADEMSIADGCKQADAELNDSFARLKASLS